MIQRILFSVLLLFSVLFCPLWLSLILALGGIFFFNFYFEAVVLFLISDLLFGYPEVKFLGMTTVSFLLSISILILSEFTKRKLKFYPKY